ncbi:LytR/AlgR family response regulator transcription factor [Halocola ammonii]
MDNLRCILIEDEQPASEILRNYLGNFPNFTLEEHFVNVFKAQEYLHRHKVDVIFLDIQLPGMSGMDFLKTLEQKPLIVVTSAYEQHALEAFDLEVFDYLLKPYSLIRFTKTIQRICRHFRVYDISGEEEGSQSIHVKSGREDYKIPVESIRYIESQKEYVLINLKDGTQISTRMTMTETLQKLPEGDFMQIHRSFIVSIPFIKATTSTEVVLGNQRLPIGRAYKKLVEERWGR